MLPQHAALIAASAVSADVATARGYRTITKKSELKELGFGDMQARVPALLIPIHSVVGDVALYQTRPDVPRIKDAKTLKYETPLKARMVLDVPPAARPQLGNPAVPLFITEGVRKADAAVSMGLCCVALLGVWNWRGTNGDGGRVALPEWESVALNGRQTYVVFDSDVMLKPEVGGALGRLKEFLESRGAKVAPVYLPAGEAGAKVGLDDYLAAGHTVDELLALASPTLRPPAMDDEREGKPAKGRAIELEDPDPVEGHVDGALLLDEIVSTIARFIVLPEAAAEAVALWIVHTYLMDGCDITPLLALSSPVKRCGKTSLLRIIAGLARRPLPVSGISAAAIYRTVEEHEPTLLIDEMDSMKDNEDLRGVLNSGHTRDLAYVIRVVGEGGNMEPRRFSTWCPKVLAHIGSLPATVEDRAIRISMRRKEPGDVRERIRRRKLDATLSPIRPKVARWAQDNIGTISEPMIPDELDDRAADNWEPLLAIADAAGGRWPVLARRVALKLSLERTSDEADDNPGILLLADLRDLIDSNKVDIDGGLSGDEACEALRKIEDRPWKTWGRGRDGLLPVHLSKLLRPFGIKTDRRTRKARRYPFEAFQDAFGRYLTPARDGFAAPVAPVTEADPSRESSDGSMPVTPVTGVTGPAGCDGSEDETAAQAPAPAVDPESHVKGNHYKVGDVLPDGRKVLEVDEYGPVAFSKALPEVRL